MAKYIVDLDILNLLYNIIDSFHTNGKPRSGLPLGNLTSQLLVNIYMNVFDQYMKHNLKQIYYIRYADDFVTIDDNYDSLLKLISHIQNFLITDLKLTLHPNKVSIRKLHHGIDFLGWIEFGNYRVLRTSTKKRILKKLESNGYKKESVDSYMGLLGHGNTYGLKEEILKLKSIFFDN